MSTNPNDVKSQDSLAKYGTDEETVVGRRQFLRSLSVGALAVTGGALLAGCGGGGGGQTVNVTEQPSPSNPTAAVEPAMVARLAPFFAASATSPQGTSTLFDGASESGLTPHDTGGSSTSVTVSVTSNGSTTAFASASTVSTSGGSTSVSGSSVTVEVVNGVTLVSVSSSSQTVSAQSAGAEGGDPNIQLSDPAGMSVGFNQNAAAAAGLSADEIRQGNQYAQALAALTTVSLPDQQSHLRANLNFGDLIHSYDNFVATYIDFLRYIADSQDNPNHRPVDETFNTKYKAMSAMWSRGYHLVRPYASGGGNSQLRNFQRCASSNSDRGRPQSLYSDIPPKSCCYRDEVNLITRGNNWGYYVQYHEPNPEVLSYYWPKWWWPYFVYWYHLNF